ncbi:unnamed protein product [Citrullus colocynthis]|uniref:Uncharacterized protein n=1 Tax=Citrullus colocynthis TaxID=252529 RepID=A0ABP0YAZ1_9ROSI
MEAPISSRGWSKHGRSLSNQRLFAALLATQKDMLSANGAQELASLFLEIICFVKFHPETLAVSFVLARALRVALTVREQVTGPSGWENHPSLNSLIRCCQVVRSDYYFSLFFS